MRDIWSKAARVRLVIFDVDGVLTDGRLYFGNDGNEFKAFHIRDGHGIKMLAECGVEIAIITGRRSRMVEERARNLGIRRIYQGYEDKRTAFQALLAELAIAPERCGAIGDDVLDLPLFTRCGFAATVPDAPEIVRRHAHLVTRAGGGRGAAREVCEFIMQAKGRLDSVLARYLD